MNRDYYLNLAATGLRMPIGADLVLREKDDPEAITLDGARLGAVVAEAARRFETPLAIPLMDLMVEKTLLLEMLGVPSEEIPTYHFSGSIPDDAFATLDREALKPPSGRFKASCDAIAYVANEPDLLPIGMCIGPFSLMTKLIADPISPVYMAGAGTTAEEDPDVKLVEDALELSIRIILHSVREQIKAGAKAMTVAEPAANNVYFSPRQIHKGSDIYERYAISYNQRLKALLDESGVDLIFHCCGELLDGMVKDFARLDPVILSLGSSRTLWEDAALVPNHIVMFGNLPSKRFYSDDLISLDEVKEISRELVLKMRETGHPFILGSECDVLSVPGCQDTIKSKVQAMVNLSLD